MTEEVESLRDLRSDFDQGVSVAMDPINNTAIQRGGQGVTTLNSYWLQLVKTPYIDGGTHPWGGEVRPYLDPPHGPYYGCSLSPEDRSIADVPYFLFLPKEPITEKL